MIERNLGALSGGKYKRDPGVTMKGLIWGNGYEVKEALPPTEKVFAIIIATIILACAQLPNKNNPNNR